MRISDWSSDVCSSDLPRAAADPGRRDLSVPLRPAGVGPSRFCHRHGEGRAHQALSARPLALAALRGGPWARLADHGGAGAGAGGIAPRATGGGVFLVLEAAVLSGLGRRATGAGAGD